MATQRSSKVSVYEILAFLKGRGITLSDDAVDRLKERLEEEPVGRATFDRGKSLLKNEIFKNVLDKTFVKRSNDLKKIAEDNPILKLIDEKRIAEQSASYSTPMPNWLHKAFFDEEKWQPYMPFLGIPSQGIILKIVENKSPDKPYVGFLFLKSGIETIHTTRREISLSTLENAKFYRLREGLFQYEIEDIEKLINGYKKYITS